MTLRPSTVWVITCDGPDCQRLAVPAQLDSWHRDAHKRAMHLSHAIHAFTAAHEAGWVTERQDGAKWKQYCPDHADIPTRPSPIRQSNEETK